MIELLDVGVAVRGRDILAHCTATIESGGITHLTGDNGSGKTSLIRAIAGIQSHTGSIRFDGADAARVRSSLYVCFDDAPIFPFLSGYENVRMLLGRSLSRRAIAAVAPALADHGLLKQQARKLSSGQRRRVHLVAALLSGARYLVLDEALNGVDAPSVDQLQSSLEKHAPGATVLITGHHSETYGHLAARTLRLVKGTITEGIAA